MKTHKFTVKEKDIIDFKKRNYVRRLCLQAVNRGELIRPNKCELCNCSNKQIQAHHVDYGRPMQVVWLCVKCHAKAHAKDSPLNPANNAQTPMPYIVEQYKKVTVSFEIPIQNFLAIKQEAEKQKKPIGQVMREQAMKQFPVEDGQLEFNLEVKDDESQHVVQQRVHSLEEDEGLRKQSACTVLPKVRRERNYNLQGVESKLLPILRRHGTHARAMQRTEVTR